MRTAAIPWRLGETFPFATNVEMVRVSEMGIWFSVSVICRFIDLKIPGRSHAQDVTQTHCSVTILDPYFPDVMRAWTFKSKMNKLRAGNNIRSICKSHLGYMKSYESASLSFFLMTSGRAEYFGHWGSFLSLLRILTSLTCGKLSLTLLAVVDSQPSFYSALATCRTVVIEPT